MSGIYLCPDQTSTPVSSSTQLTMNRLAFRKTKYTSAVVTQMESKHRQEHNLTMLKPGIGATEDTLRESAAARVRAQPRRQPGRRHRAVQRQQRQPRAAPELHRYPAHRHSPSITDLALTPLTALMRQQQGKNRERNGDRHLEKQGARRAAEEAARPAAKGAERAAAADRLAAEATRAAARKHVEAISRGLGRGEVRGGR